MEHTTYPTGPYYKLCRIQDSVLRDNFDENDPEEMEMLIPELVTSENCAAFVEVPEINSKLLELVDDSVAFVINGVSICTNSIALKAGNSYWVQKYYYHDAAEEVGRLVAKGNTLLLV